MKAEVSQASGRREVEHDETVLEQGEDGLEARADGNVAAPGEPGTATEQAELRALEETLALIPPPSAELTTGPLARPGARGPGWRLRAVAERLQVIVNRLPSFDDRVARVLLSILLAALLWIYVANLENPDRTTVYTNLPVEVRGLAPNLKVISPPPEVSVTIEAPQSVLATLSRADVRAYVDLTDYAPGVHLVPMRADVRADIRESGGTVSF